MARDLNKFISDHRKSHNRYISAVDSLIEKYGEGSDEELDSVINLSSCKVIKDKKGFFSKTRNLGSTKFTKHSSTKHEKLQLKESPEDDPSLIYVCDTGCDLKDTDDFRFLQDVSSCMVSFLDDGEEEPSDAETLSSSSSESYETVNSDFEVTSDNLSEVISENARNGIEEKDNTYDEVDGDFESLRSGKVVNTVIKSTNKNKYHRISDETFTIDESHGYDDYVASGHQKVNHMNQFVLNKKHMQDTEDSLVTDSQPEFQTHQSECNNNYKYENYNENKWETNGTANCGDNRDNRPVQKSSGQNKKRIQTLYTPFDQLPNYQGRESMQSKYFDKKSENISDGLLQADENRAPFEDSARKNDNSVDVKIHRNIPSVQMSNKSSDNLSPSFRKSRVRRNSDKIPSDTRYCRDTEMNGPLLSPLQCRKVNVVKSSTKTNVRRLYENEHDHEELSKKDSGVSTCHDESFATSSHTYEEIPEALTTKNLKQFNKSLIEESTFINVSLNVSGLKTDEKIGDVEKWLNNVSVEMDKEHDTSVEGNVGPMFVELHKGRHTSKPEVSKSEVRTANKIRLETSRDSEQYADNKMNIVGAHGHRSSPVLPKSPRSMQYLRNVEMMARSARQSSNETTPESHRVKLRGQRYQAPLQVFQSLQAIQVGEMMRRKGDCDEYFSPRKNSDLNGKRLINYESDLICSENDNSALPTPPKSRRISSSNSCTKSTQVNARSLSGMSSKGNQFVHLNNSQGNSNNNFDQTSDVYDYNEEFKNTGRFVNGSTKAYQLPSSQRTQNDVIYSPRKRFSGYSSIESHDLSELLGGSFKSPNRSNFLDNENNSSVSCMENPDNDLVSLNTYPAQSSVRKLNVSSNSKVRYNGQSNSCRKKSVNIQHTRRNSQNTDFPQNISNDRSDLNSQGLQQATYTMCNFMDSQPVPDRSQDSGRSTAPKRRSNTYRHVDSPTAVGNNGQNRGYPSYGKQQIAQPQHHTHSGQMSSEIMMNRQHEIGIRNDRNRARTHVRGYHDSNRDAAGNDIDECSATSGNRERFDNVISEQCMNERKQVPDYSRKNKEILRNNQNFDSYYEEQDSSELGPSTLQRSPWKQRSESLQMSSDLGQKIGNEFVKSSRQNNVRHRPSELRPTDEDRYGDVLQWNSDVHRSASLERRKSKAYVHQKSPSMDIGRRQSFTYEADIFDKFGSPNVRRSTQKQNVFESRSPSTTSRQYKDNSADFRSPTINRMKIHEEFSPSTSLAKMKLHTPKSRSKHPQQVESAGNKSNNNFDHSSSNSRKVIIDSSGANSGHRFISLDQMQSNPLLFKIHMIDAEQAESDVGAGKHVDFSNNYICDQFYDQQNRNGERDISKSNDNVYHKYCDEMRDNSHVSDDYVNNDSRVENRICQDLNNTRNSPQKHSPRMKKSLFPSRTENGSSSAISQYKTPAQINTQDFNDFKMPRSPNVVMKTKSAMHNKENVLNSSNRVTPSTKSSVYNSQSVSCEFANRLGRKFAGRGSSNYMQSTPVKPGFEFTLNTTMSTILGSDETEVNNDDEEIVLM